MSKAKTKKRRSRRAPKRVRRFKVTNLNRMSPAARRRAVRKFTGNPGGARVVYNRLLGGWYVVTGPHQTPLNGRFASKFEAEAYLRGDHRRRNPSAPAARLLFVQVKGKNSGGAWLNMAHMKDTPANRATAKKMAAEYRKIRGNSHARITYENPSARGVTRQRIGGTHDVHPRSGEERIAALRRIVADRQFAKVDGYMVDGFSASAIVQVYDALNEANRAKYREMPVAKMATVAWKLVKKNPAARVVELRGARSGTVYGRLNASTSRARLRHAARALANRHREPIAVATALENPAAPAPEIQRAARLYRGFTGHRAHQVTKVPLRPLPRVGLAFGQIVEIGYRSFRDGALYRHTFKEKAQPLAVSSHDGRQVVIVGGRYRFTHRGIEDA